MNVLNSGIESVIASHTTMKKITTGKYSWMQGYNSQLAPEQV